MNNYDYRTPFDRNCRVPGSRCNLIMSMIERGLSDKAIAARVRNIPATGTGYNPNQDCSAKTIAVYRKAYNGTLIEPAGQAFVNGRPAVWANLEAVTR